MRSRKEQGYIQPYENAATPNLFHDSDGARDVMDESAPLLAEERPPTGYGSLGRSTTKSDDDHSLASSTVGGDDGIIVHPYNVSTPTPTLRARLQIPLLCFVRIMEPISFYTIFPYIAQMTRHNGDMPDSDVGFYTGLFESLFSAVQALVLVFWGSMADRVGYKPMLVWSLSGMAVAPVLFGLSTTLWQMAVFRCLIGAFAGSNVIIRSLLMHRCTPENQVRAFSWYTFADNFALFFGPLIGGALADPAAQYPSLFGGVSFFERFPYALPGLVTGGLCAIGVLVTLLFIDDCGDIGSTSESDAGIPAARPSLVKLVRAPGVLAVLCTLMCGRVLSSSMSAVSTTALPTRIAEGGMSYTSRQIALLITAQGAVEAVWLLAVFPVLHRRIRTKGILYLTAVMFPMIFGSYILMSVALRYPLAGAQVWHWAAWLVIVLLGSGVLMAGTSGQLALQNLTPDLRALGTLNAVAETCTSAVKMVTPAVSTTIFAIGVRNQALGGYLGWVVLICISPISLIAVYRLPSWTHTGRM